MSRAGGEARSAAGVQMVASDTIEHAVQVRPLSQSDEHAWKRYVLDHPIGAVFHLPAWSRAVTDCYGHLPVHLGAFAAERMVGVLPMFQVNSVFVGRVLVSIPYATYGGILADAPAVARELLAAARELRDERRCRYVELRHREPSGLDLPELDRYDTFRKQLPDRAEDILPQLPRKTRAAARKGLDALGEPTIAEGGRLVDEVYDLYAATLRRLGSPNYRRSLFRRLAELYGTDCVCTVVRDAGRPAAAVLSLVFRDEIVPYFSGSTDDGMRKNANNVMYVKLMEYAVNRGLRLFDFNRTRRDNRGPHAFKRYHGFEPAPLHYQFCAAKEGDIPNLSPSNRTFALAGKIWRKMPLWATRAIGAQVTKWIP